MAVYPPGDVAEVAVEVELIRGDTRGQRGEKEGGVRCGEVRRGRLLFIGSSGGGGEAVAGGVREEECHRLMVVTTRHGKGGVAE
jgi:hypothetical protein